MLKAMVLVVFAVFALQPLLGCGGDDDDGGGVCAQCCECKCEGAGCTVTFTAQPESIAEGECLDCEQECNICSMPFIACGSVTEAKACQD